MLLPPQDMQDFSSHPLLPDHHCLHSPLYTFSAQSFVSPDLLEKEHPGRWLCHEEGVKHLRGVEL